MFSIMLWLAVIFLGLYCLMMIMNGVRGDIEVISRWALPQQVQQDEQQNADAEATRPKIEPRQYTLNMKSLKDIKIASFSLNLSRFGHATLRPPSVFSTMDHTKLRARTLCFSVLNSFDQCVDSLRQYLSKNGKVYHDPQHPVVMKLEYRAMNGDIFSTSFLIFHADTYAYCFRVCNKWMIFDDSPYNLISENGEEAPSIFLKSSYPGDSNDFVGVSTIITALKDLNKHHGEESERKWKKAVLHLVFCFIESAKFRDIEHFVRSSLIESFLGDPYIFKKATPDNCGGLVNFWGTLCNALLKFENTGEFPVSSKDRTRFLITGDTAAEQAQCGRFMVPVRLR